MFTRGLTQREIAANEGVTVQAIKMRLHRARKAGKQVPTRLATVDVKVFALQNWD
jgi:DNA-directed RNA polymerase specialized sigma24 family protein